MKVGDLVRGSETNIRPQRNSVAVIVDQAYDGSFSIFWLSGEIKGTRVVHNFRPDELEVISEGG